jgi:L-threonylcarbamoyladenylate synthase
MGVLHVDPLRFDLADLEPAVGWLRAGGVVAFPTETFYGLAVDPASPEAVSALFELKGRPARLALPLIAPSTDSVELECGRLTPLARRLAEAFWPGPMSLIVEPHVSFAAGVCGRDGTVAIRVPGHRVARSLAQAWGGPVTATSANRSGSPAARKAEELGALAADPCVLVIDGGETPGGLASTIVDARRSPPTLVRAGAVPWDRVLRSAD